MYEKEQQFINELYDLCEKHKVRFEYEDPESRDQVVMIFENGTELESYEWVELLK